jgi:N6-L-threonylcarbamoyladenine synthase
VASNVISSQGVHDRYGGVVPEVAARHHLDLIDVVIADALARASTTLDDVSLVAATAGPGLVAALLVGLSTAKGLAGARGLPFAPVDHLEGHVASAFVGPDRLETPFVSLIASGGHTLLLRVDRLGGPYEVLARTLDDAAGEAFDKGARLLGLGYPGGAALERLAAGGDAQAFAFPTGRTADFSFAGVKTALLYKVRAIDPLDDAARADLAASYQEAIVTALVRRIERVLAETGLRRLAIGGGVAANQTLRSRVGQLGVELAIPPIELCTDNAAMIGVAALHGVSVAYPGYLAVEAYATGEGSLQ